MCEELLKKKVAGEKLEIPSKWSTLDHQIYLLKIFEKLKKEKSHYNDETKFGGNTDKSV